mgnify:CR=1 FL=1
MSISRYKFTRVIEVDGKKYYGTSKVCYQIKNAIDNNLLEHATVILKQSQRLDHVAGVAYGDSGLWWVIAAASGIGWGLQVPPGTIIKVPNDIDSVFSIL